jgi:hypothetical protein
MYNSSLYLSQSRPSRPSLSLRSCDLTRSLSTSELPPSPSHARGKMSRFSDNNVSSSHNMLTAFRSLFLLSGGSDDEQFVPLPITTSSSLLLHSGKLLTSPTYSSSSLQYDGKQFTPYSQRYHQNKRDSSSPQWLMGYGPLGVWPRKGVEKSAQNLLSPINESKSSQSISASTSSFMSPSSSSSSPGSSSTRSAPSPMLRTQTSFLSPRGAVFPQPSHMNVMTSQMIGSFIMASIFVWPATVILAFLTLMHHAATMQKKKW